MQWLEGNKSVVVALLQMLALLHKVLQVDLVKQEEGVSMENVGKICRFIYAS
jgi:hypothetical protein